MRVAHSTGVFWAPDNGVAAGLLPNDPATGAPTAGFVKDSFRMSLDFVSSGDGNSNTILFGENLQGGNWAWHPGASGQVPADCSSGRFLVLAGLNISTGNSLKLPLNSVPGKLTLGSA